MIVFAASCQEDASSDPGEVAQGSQPELPEPAYGGSTVKAPHENFDLTHWKLTLPSGDEISSRQLQQGYQLANVFYTDPYNGGLVMRSPNIAGHTRGSKYPRCEFREMRKPDGSASDSANNWTTSTGGRLKVALQVDAVSATGDSGKRGRVVIGQIHGPDTEVVRLYFDKEPHERTGRLYVGTDRVRSGDSTLSADIVSNKDGNGIGLGEPFGYEIDLHGLQLKVTIRRPRGEVAVFNQTIDPLYEGLDLYFKAGVYNQNNTGDSTDYAQATLFAIQASH
ncbi:polysaccharide lyase family 7 protein [Panacagrimonas perspica]|nr:polysaccharide lyase family 7 protein [Panacagrimonas perspica]